MTVCETTKACAVWRAELPHVVEDVNGAFVVLTQCYAVAAGSKCNAWNLVCAATHPQVRDDRVHAVTGGPCDAS